MKKFKVFLLAILMMASFTCAEAKKKKKRKKVFPKTFIDFQGRKTTKATTVFAPPLDRPDFDFSATKYFRNGNFTGIKIDFEREADINPGKSFPIVGNFGSQGESTKGNRARISTSFTYGKGNKRKEFSATGLTGTVSIFKDDRGFVFLLVRAETTNGTIYRIDSNGDRRDKIKDINLVVEADIPFVYGHITRYNENCFQPRDPDGIQQECVTTVDDINTFK